MAKEAADADPTFREEVKVKIGTTYRVIITLMSGDREEFSLPYRPKSVMGPQDVVLLSRTLSERTGGDTAWCPYINPWSVAKVECYEE